MSHSGKDPGHFLIVEGGGGINKIKIKMTDEKTKRELYVQYSVYCSSTVRTFKQDVLPNMFNIRIQRCILHLK